MAMSSDVENALVDITAEFARSWGDEVTEEMRDTLLDRFNKTVRKGIEEYGIRWEEPIRSYALKHAAKVGRKLALQGSGNGAGAIGPVSDDVIDQARKACEVKANVLAMELGPLCPPL